MAASTDHAKEAKKLKSKAKASLALLLVAVISITTATYAWFTLSNSAMVQSMTVEVGTGTKLKIYAGTTASTNFSTYFSTIKNDGTGVLGEKATDALPGTIGDTGVTIDSFDDVKLWPVTSGNGRDFYTHITNITTPAVSSGPEKKYYVQMVFTFLADTDMDVYLNKENSSSTIKDGTSVLPAVEGNVADQNAIKALRISFTSLQEDSTIKSVIYEPGRGAEPQTPVSGNAGGGNTITPDTFTNLGTNIGRNKGDADKETPVIFSLKKDLPKVVTMRIWAEGEDPQCVNGNGTGDNSLVNIEKAKLKLQLRFCGADANGNYIEVAGS